MARSVTLLDRRLFIKKLVALVIGTLLFIPLVYYKLRLPAILYAGGLLILHIYFLYLYFAHTPWRRLLRSKAAFTIRAIAVVFFIYMLSLIKFGGTPAQVVGKLGVAFAIHLGILLGMMLVRVAPANAKSAARSLHTMIE